MTDRSPVRPPAVVPDPHAALAAEIDTYWHGSRSLIAHAIDCDPSLVTRWCASTVPTAEWRARIEAVTARRIQAAWWE